MAAQNQHFVACLFRALERYCHTKAGALYKFSWVFPRGADGKGIGFSTKNEIKDGESYAHYPEDRIAVKLQSELREHPLLLLPARARRAWIDAHTQDHDAPNGGTHFAQLFEAGDLGHKNREIFNALMRAYRGDLERVFAHVQIERWYVSHRYRRGAITIGPQLSVDARERQISADRSLASLPASLSALSLFESFGELVDGAGGVIEFSDLLKRPLESWKYLLLAVEEGQIALSHSNLPLNSVMLASSNELHLNAFRQHPEYESFRGRIAFVRVPYLRDYRDETEIYQTKIARELGKHIAPHSIELMALWGVMTRLLPADKSRYHNENLGELAASLNPLEKALLYADGTKPARIFGDDGKRLEEGIKDIYYETHGNRSDDLYEGRIGISPRSLRSLLLALGADDATSIVTPLEIFSAIDALCEPSRAGGSEHDFS